MKNSTSHLGGHLYRTWTDEKTLKYLIEKYEVKSMVDVGCGVFWSKIYRYRWRYQP